MRIDLPLLLPTLVLKALALGVLGISCSFHSPPLADSLDSIDENPFEGQTGDIEAVIEISVPQVFSRESLINDRRNEEEYLAKLLRESQEKPFPPELVRDLSTVATLAADLGLSFDPAKALEYGAAREKLDAQTERDVNAIRREIEDGNRESEVRDVQHQIAITQLTIQLESLRAELEQAKEGAPANAEESSTALEPAQVNGVAVDADSYGSAVTLPSLTSAESRMAELSKATDGLLEKLKSQSAAPRTTGVQPDPREDFRARQAYRQDLRAALAESRLDDVHDKKGDAYYRFQFQATVAPGKYKNKWGVAFLTPSAPSITTTQLANLYMSWLAHATYRLNQADAHQLYTRQRITDPLYRSLAVGSRAYTIRNIYFSPQSEREGVADPCDAVRTLVEAQSKNCDSFMLALPSDPEASVVFSQQMPSVKGVILGALADKVEEAAGRSLQFPLVLRMEPAGSRVCAVGFEGQQPGGVDGPSFRQIENAADLAARIVEQYGDKASIRNLYGRVFGQAPTSAFRSTSEYVSYVGLLQGTSSSPDALVAGRRAESRIIEFVLEASLLLDLGEWLSLISANEALGYAIAAIVSSRAVASSLHGLTSRRDLSSAAKYKIEATLSSLTDSANAARRFIDSVYQVNGCAVPETEEEKNHWRAENERYLRSGAEYQQLATNIPTEFYEALVQDPTRCRKLFDNNNNEKCFLKGRAYVHATSPQQLSQRVSTVASATRALQLAASISAAFPSGGQSAGAGIGLAKGATGQVDALERVPLVVGFSSEQADDDSAEFGWVFGPKATLDPENDTIKMSQTLSSYTLTADILVPAWWPEISFNVKSGWVGNWYDGQLVDLGGAKPRTISKLLPINRADLDSITTVIAGTIYGEKLQRTEIYDVYPREISLCSNDITLLIYGTNIWRGTEVYLEGIPAKSGSIQILPDMEGISANFDASRLARKSSKKQKPTLYVWTQNGFDSRELDLTGTIDKNGQCEDVPSRELPGKRIVALSPKQISRCSTETVLVVRTHDFVVERAFLGSVGNNGDIQAFGDGSDRSFIISFEDFAGRNKGLSSWSLTLVANDGAVLTSDIQAFGERENCDVVSTPPDPKLSVLLTNEAGLNVCSVLESVTLIGADSHRVTRGTFMGVDSSRASHPARDVTVLAFSRLPRFEEAGVPKQSKLRYVIGEKTYTLNVPLRCE